MSTVLTGNRASL